MGLLAAILFTCLLKLSMAETGTLKITGTAKNSYRGVINIPIKATVKGGWKVHLHFKEPIKILSAWTAKITHRSQLSYTLENKPWNSNINPGTTLKIGFHAKLIKSNSNPAVNVTFQRKPPLQCPIVTPPGGVHAQKANVKIFEGWPVAFKATVSLISPGDVQQWKIHLAFSKTVTLLQVPKATAVRVNDKYFTVTRAPWARSTLKYGEKLDIEFIAYVQGETLPCITALFTWKGTLITSSPPTEDPSTPAITTEEPASVNPSTVQPSIGQRSTVQPSSGKTSTGQPCTCYPSTGQPSSAEPFTGQSSKDQPSFTSQSSTLEPFTVQSSTDQTATGQPSTGQQYTVKRFTGQPSTVQPSTEQCPIVTPPGDVHAQKGKRQDLRALACGIQSHGISDISW